MSKDKLMKPEVIVIAGPNGSGKSTITKMVKTVGVYINADDIKSSTLCTDLKAAVTAERLRNTAIDNRENFTFETVLSTDRNLKLLKRAKREGYFIRCIYVLTSDVNVNIARVNSRVALGGHGVPIEKIRTRYERALKLVPELIQVCDIVHIYDNSVEPFRIFKKRKDVYYKWESPFWSSKDIDNLTGIEKYDLFIKLEM